MRKIMRIIPAILMLLVSCSLQAQTIPASPAQTVNQVMTDFMKQNQVPGVAVIIYVDGKPSSYYYGYAKPARHVPVTDRTIFDLGSMTNIMTGLLLAQEIDVAKMGLDDAVGDYLKHLPESFNTITLQNLATDTSGLPFAAPDDINTRWKLRKYLAAWTPDKKPGDEWLHSNLGMGILGSALEHITHQSYNSLYRRHISSQLGMQPIGVTVPGWLHNQYAQGHDKDGNAVPQTRADIYQAADGVRASAADMRRFLGAAIGLPGTPMKVFYPMRMTQAAYVRLHDGMQGLGWQVHKFDVNTAAGLLDANSLSEAGAEKVLELIDKPLFYPDALIDKTGSGIGFRSYIAVLPAKKSGIVILANKNVDKQAIVYAGRKILFELNNIKTTVEKPSAG